MAPLWLAAVSLNTDSWMAAAAGTSQAARQESSCSSAKETEIRLLVALAFELDNTGPVMANTLAPKYEDFNISS